MNYISSELQTSVGTTRVESLRSSNDAKLVGSSRNNKPQQLMTTMTLEHHRHHYNNKNQPLQQQQDRGGCIKKKTMMKKKAVSSNKYNQCHHHYDDDDVSPFHYLHDDHHHQATKNPTTNHRKKVWFGKVELIEFPIILGDNPTPDDGFPITIGWDPQHIDVIEIDYFEMFYQRRRSGMDLFLNASTRAELAIKGGASITKVPFVDWPLYFRSHPNLNKKNKDTKTKTTAATATTSNKRSSGQPRRDKMTLADEHMIALHHATMKV